MQVSGRAVPKRYDRARPLACCINAAVSHQASLDGRTQESNGRKQLLGRTELESHGLTF